MMAMLQAFDRIDTSDDDLISKKEFMDPKMKPCIQRWVNITDWEGEWKCLDRNGGGKVIGVTV